VVVVVVEVETVVVVVSVVRTSHDEASLHLHARPGCEDSQGVAETGEWGGERIGKGKRESRWWKRNAVTCCTLRRCPWARAS
jgi:hypothetical protein